MLNVNDMGEPKAQPMFYYGIKTPKEERHDSYIHWIAKDEHEAWNNFFGANPHRLPLFQAIEAYKAIGYKSVKLEMREIEDY